MRRGPVTFVAPHGPGSDPLPSQRSGMREPGRQRRGVPRPGASTRPAAKGRTTKQAAARTARALEAIRATAHLPCTGPWAAGPRARTARRRRRVDMALISVMRDAMPGRSEADAVIWADVEFDNDGSARGLWVRRSRSEEANGATPNLSRAAATNYGRPTVRTLFPHAPVLSVRWWCLGAFAPDRYGGGLVDHAPLR